MIRLKKILPIVLSATLLATVLGGCGSKENTDSSGSEKTEIRFSWWGGEARHEATLKAIDKYMSENPSVKITAEYGGFDGYKQKLITQLSGGTAADIVQVDQPWIGELMSKDDFFYNLYDEDNIDLSGIDDEFLKKFLVYEESLQGIPAGINADGIIYNKSFFEKFNISTDEEWTWDRILEEGTRINQEDPESHLFNLDLASVANIVLTYVKQETGKVIVNEDYKLNASEADMEKAFTYVKDLFESGTAQPLQEANLFAGNTEQNPKWNSGQLGGTTGWIAIATAFRNDAFEIGISTVPCNENVKGVRESMRPSVVYSISNNSQYKEEAAKFLDWLINSDEATEILVDARGIQPVESVRKKLLEKNLISQDMNNVVSAALEESGEASNLVNDNSEIMEILSSISEKVAFGEITPKEATKEYIEKIDKKLLEIKQ